MRTKRKKEHSKQFQRSHLWIRKNFALRSLCLPREFWWCPGSPAVWSSIHEKKQNAGQIWCIYIVWYFGGCLFLNHRNAIPKHEKWYTFNTSHTKLFIWLATTLKLVLELRLFTLHSTYRCNGWLSEKNLDKLPNAPEEYNFMDTLAKTFIIPAQQNQFVYENIFDNAPIRRIAIAMNTYSAVTGFFTENPFLYQQFDRR